MIFLAHFAVWLPWILLYLFAFWFLFPLAINSLFGGYDFWDFEEFGGYFRLGLKINLWVVAMASALSLIILIVCAIIKFSMWGNAFLTAT